MADGSQRPTVRLFVVCADAVLLLSADGEPLGGHWEIANALHTVWMQPGYMSQVVPRLSVYAQLTDGHGRFNLGVTVEELDLADPRRDRLVGWSDPHPVELDDPWEVTEEVIELRDIPFPRPGQYRFRLLETV